jgi:deazaflavin-dependent oxidoreductase (nitroreductase family)
MSSKLADKRTPHGPLRLMLRAPIWLYRWHLGWLLGHRFLMLTHIGRKSGQPRRTVLEVVNWDKATGAYYIASGWGERSDWLRNVEKTPQVQVDVGGRHFTAIAERVATDEAASVLYAYARRHPFAFRELAGVMAGRKLQPTAADSRVLAAVVPLVALRQ